MFLSLMGSELRKDELGRLLDGAVDKIGIKMAWEAGGSLI